MENNQTALSVQDLHKSFGDVEVLKGICLTAHKGDVISVLGSSGSGKSTLLRCINFLEEPTAGTVEVDGTAINAGGTDKKRENQIIDIRKKTGMCFQAFNLFPHMTALENITEIVSSYLFKDILEFQHLKKPDVLLELLKLLAFQISNEVSYTELARKLRVDQTVVQRYIQLLEDSFIIFRLKALKKNLRNEIGKSRKIYFWDLGVRNALIQNTNSLDFRNDQGALWENFCVAEREKTMDYNIPRIVNTYFWRNYNQKEIDLIEERGEKYIAYEFKWSTVKKFKPPADFIKGYPGSEFRVVTPENFVSEIYS